MSEPLFAYDASWREKGHEVLAGVDEAGRGPWAGPVVAAAVVMAPGVRWTGLNDSKKLSPPTRERLYDEICRGSLFYSVALVDAAVIDEINILQATFRAMSRALEGLGTAFSLVLVDGNQKIPHIPPSKQEAVVGGDGRSASIAAASILAKVTRDRWMAEAHEKFPLYGFHRHKGYGTADHAEALRRHGPCPIHRMSFAPLKTLSSPGPSLS